MNVVEVLQAARCEVAKGWCQKTLERNGAVCALGALNRVDTGDAYITIESSEALKAWGLLAMYLPDPYGRDVVAYNNAETTTRQDILNLFDKTLADLGGLA